MKIIKPCDLETVDLLKTTDPNRFGEALRDYCFVGNCMQTGCYSTFELIDYLNKVESGPIYEEAKKQLIPEFDDRIHVYHYKIEEKDCWLEYDGPDGKPDKMKMCEPYEIVCAWYWDGDGTLYFRFNNRKVINTDCKKDYVWAWCLK